MFGFFKNKHVEKDDAILMDILHMGFEGAKQGRGNGFPGVLAIVTDMTLDERVQAMKENTEFFARCITLNCTDAMKELVLDSSLKDALGHSFEDVSGWFSRNNKNLIAWFVGFATHVLDMEVNGVQAFNLTAKDIVDIRKAITHQDIETLKSYGLVK